LTHGSTGADGALAYPFSPRKIAVRLEKKVALVTGGASGIGRATAIHFAREGARVVIMDIVESAGRETEELVRSEGVEGLFLSGTVTSPSDWQHIVDRIAEDCGRLDVLFNNAGTNLLKDVMDLSEPEWDALFLEIRLGRRLPRVRGGLLRHWSGDLRRWRTDGMVTPGSGSRLKGGAQAAYQA
jgi:hypothetical protein